MASEYRNIPVLKSIVIVFITYYYLFNIHFADGRKFIAATLKHKGTIKSIESANGEVIDCVDIYKQPAFDHPLLKNHTIEILEGSIQNDVYLQEWNQNGEYCPDGSIPVVRTPKLDYPKKVPKSFTSTKDLNVDVNKGHEYAVVGAATKNYGASARLNVWSPLTEFREFSLAQIWVISGQQYDRNTMEAGWMVYSGEKDPHLFIYWTRDNYQSTGCYNLRCPGFVQVSSRVALGGIIKPSSSYNGLQIEIQLTISKDQKSGNWWLRFGDENVGYWPKSIFTTLADSSDLINWGGEIINAEFDGHHTTTQMGSGHFPNEGVKKASYFSFVKYMDVDGTFKDAQGLIPYITNPSCYDVLVGKSSDTAGTYFYFGGPGYSDTCR